MKVIETQRLILRTWTDKDIQAFFMMNQDPKVIEFLRGSMSLEQIKLFIQKCNSDFEKKSFCLFAAELKENKNLIGFIGLSEPSWEAHFTPAVEIGWRLSSEYWGKGYATEGAKAVLNYGFRECKLKEIVSFTVPKNIRSIRVMEKIGMQRDLSGDFAHPQLSADHPLSRHVLYKIKSQEMIC